MCVRLRWCSGSTETQDIFQKGGGCIVSQYNYFVAEYSLLCRFLQNRHFTLVHLLTHNIGSSMWRSPTMGQLYARPQWWVMYMLDPNDGSCDCRPQPWVNYMLDHNDGSCNRWLPNTESQTCDRLSYVYRHNVWPLPVAYIYGICLHFRDSCEILFWNCADCKLFIVTSQLTQCWGCFFVFCFVWFPGTNREGWGCNYCITIIQMYPSGK